jgi:mRNA interferase RelE/StbE
LSDFRVFETVQFLDDLEKISGLVYPQLSEQPYFGTNIKKLKGFKPETWRYRIGSYRFFYIVDDKEKIVFMVAADTRQQSY